MIPIACVDGGVGEVILLVALSGYVIKRIRRRTNSMPCFAIIRAIQGLKTLKEVSSAARELDYEYTKEGTSIHVTIPVFGKLTFTQTARGIEAPGLREADQKMFLAGKNTASTKSFFRDRGLKISGQKVTDKGIELVIKS